MASSSSSPVHKSFKYDVFLSFRGEDTRKTFVDHLYHALEQKSIRTYKDDERITKGKRISDELIRSIEDSRYSIIIFSKNYASSSWCLNELVKIMECHKKTEHTAYPVFYDVEPSEVRKQSGAVGEAFAKHEKKKAAEKWRRALKEAADLAGWELKKTADGHEAKVIKIIVEEVSLELRSVNFRIDDKLVGMETRINDIVSYFEDASDKVCMIGIWGMGGGGKTTLARALYDQISFQFEGISFVEDVREVSNASLSGLKLLQSQVLSDVLNDQGIRIRSVTDGKNMMWRMMGGRKVLVVLDDVDHIDQLEALAGDPSWFKPGSVIIITTRDDQVLVAHGVKLIHKANLLSNKEAICLFSRYAFGREIPIHGYEELSEEVVHYASGLPLTIRVLGSFLCGKEHLEWVDAIKRLKTIPLKETRKKLELSYTCLEEDYKEIFLDVACMWKGRQKKEAIEALESCGYHARNGLKVLEQKSLITIVEKRVCMHDHIEEMGRNIVRRSYPYKPSTHSRLWIAEEVEDIFRNDLGTKATRCIRYYSKKLDLEIIMKGLIKMKELRFLHITGGSDFWKYDDARPFFPNALRYLCFDQYPFRSLPQEFDANNLVALLMPSSKIVELWEGGDGKVLNKLRFLDLSLSTLRIFDLKVTPNLETLRLSRCASLEKLHMPISCLRLRSLNLFATKLRTFHLGSTPNLETLVIGRHGNLVELYMPVECRKLRILELYGSALRMLDLGLTPNLEKLVLGGDLEELRMPLKCLKLRSLTFSGSKLRTLDLGLTPNLEKLDLSCDMVELYIPVACQKLRSLELSCSKLRTLDLGLTPNLERLILGGCHDLVELRAPNGCLKLKRLICIGTNLKTLSLGLAVNLESLDIIGCDNLVEIHMPRQSLYLIRLSLDDLKLRTLDIGHTPNLYHINLIKCLYFEEFPMADNCQELFVLYITRSKLRTLDLRLALNLVYLSLCECYDLVELHMLGTYLYLKEFDLTNSNLRTLELGMTPNLKRLDLKGCYNLVELHAPIECLKQLVYLNLSGCLRFRYFLFEIKDDTDESLQFGPLAELSFSLERCPIHPENNLPKFQFTCLQKEDIPSLARNLEKLMCGGLCACKNLERFSRSIFGLQSKKKFQRKGSMLMIQN